MQSDTPASCDRLSPLPSIPIVLSSSILRAALHARADAFRPSLPFMPIPTHSASNHQENVIVSPDRDALSRFLLETSGVRGVIVRLTDTWQTIRSRSQYPAAVAERLGETLAATALFTGHAKVDGRLSVQLRGTGALRSLFAECTHAGPLRGLGQYHEPLAPPPAPRRLPQRSRRPGIPPVGRRARTTTYC